MPTNYSVPSRDDQGQSQGAAIPVRITWQELQRRQLWLILDQLHSDKYILKAKHCDLEGDRRGEKWTTTLIGINPRAKHSDMQGCSICSDCGHSYCKACSWQPCSYLASGRQDLSWPPAQYPAVPSVIPADSQGWSTGINSLLCFHFPGNSFSFRINLS